MHARVRLGFAAACAVLLNLPASLSAQDEIMGWVLSGIYTGRNSESKKHIDPTSVEATPEGGVIETTLVYDVFGKKGSETYRGTWKFDRDIRVPAAHSLTTGR